MDYDTVIIGGGPGGSTAGAFLARAGQKVLLLEKEVFPRFHIGESLLPFGNDVLKDLEVWDKLECSGFMPKYGAEFTTGNSRRFNRLWFAKGLTPGYGKTFQVERSRFDHILLQHAAERGCEVREGHRVTSVHLDNDGATIDYEGLSSHDDSTPKNGGSQKAPSISSGQARCRWVVDASGRDSFLGRHLNLPREKLDIPKRIAIYAHFKGVYRNPGEAEGHITVVRMRDGWCWFIPLDAEKTSVGLVQGLEGFKQSGLAPEQSFERAMTEQPELQFRIKSAERMGEIYTTSDYTYRHKSMAGARMLLVGDAAGFIDPIFSSGVMIALKSGQLAARHILAAHSGNRALTEQEQGQYTREVRRMIGVYMKMIRIFYNNPGFEVFIQPNPRFGILQGVNSVVAGNTSMSFSLWWRVKVFFLFCWLQKWFPVVPRIEFDAKKSGEGAATAMKKTKHPVSP